MSTDKITKLSDEEIISKLQGNLVNYRTDIAERNTYIDTRDRYLYGDGLWEELNIPDGFDQTFYNYLRRITEIHANELMGEPFGIYSWFGTDNLSAMPGQKPDPQKDQMTQIENQLRETKARGRKDAIEGIIRDNGGYRLFNDGAQVGSDYGSTLYQMWFDKEEGRIRLELIESIQNWFPVWADNSFRTRIGDAYISQIAVETANTKYGKYLPTDQAGFPTSYAGDPLINLQGSSSTMTNQQGQTTSSASTRRPMVTVYNYTGILPNVAYDKQGNFIEVAPGKEQKLSFKVVGNVVVEKITKEDYMPSFYYIPNRPVPRRPYGESDVPQAALEINATILQLKSDQHTLANKELFPMLKGHNYENASLPKRKQREAGFIPMAADQDVSVLAMPTNNLSEYARIIQDRMHDLLAITAVPATLFYDPETNHPSSTALMTSMRPMLSVVQRKQKVWEPILRQMFEDALKLAAKFDKSVKELVTDDEDWYLYVRWPSALRKEDPAHQAMLINDLRAGVKSVQTYMEERGYINPDQEIYRIGQDLKDKVRAGILGGKLGELAQFAIFEALGIPLWGFNQPHISLKGDLTPQQEGNMGAMQGWNTPDQPFGASIGPQGLAGERANENEINQGFVTGGTQPYAKYGMPTGSTPGQPINPTQPGQPVQPGNPGAQAPATSGGAPSPQAAPIVMPQQNQPDAMPMSMPGSGATTTSQQGAVRHGNQVRGK
jgi:hypothetical protein